MSEPASISSGIAQRYATALFELAKEENQIGALESDAEALAAALDDSADFRDLITSPLYSREDQAGAVDALAGAMGLTALTRNTLALMAARRRLFVLRPFVAALRERIAEEKGEVTAEVTSATALSPEQSEALARTLSATVGKTVKLHTTVDEKLIGGLVVKVGSKMIDTSIRSKLAALQNVMKEVG